MMKLYTVYAKEGSIRRYGDIFPHLRRGRKERGFDNHTEREVTKWSILCRGTDFVRA